MAQITLNSTGVASNGSLVLQSNGTTAAVTVDTSQNVGIGLTPTAFRLTTNVASGDNTFGQYVGSTLYGYLQTSANYVKVGTNAATPVIIETNGTERARIDSSGNLGIGTTSPSAKLHTQIGSGLSTGVKFLNGGSSGLQFYTDSNLANADAFIESPLTGVAMIFKNSGSERMRIDSSGNLLVGKTGDTFSAVGGVIRAVGSASFTVTSNEVLDLNRLSTDGKLQRFFQDTTEEGNISVSGTTVSYNGGHLSRYAQTTTAKDESLVKGTVLSNLDAMNVYTDAEGNLVDNEQLNKVKVSDAEGDANVAGVFVNWTHDEDHNVDEINMAMTGDMIIRIAQGVAIARGDLLMSAGDGTAKPQGDDIVRSKTVAKVTSTHVTCTYPDGSFCVPCVLMAC